MHFYEKKIARQHCLQIHTLGKPQNSTLVGFAQVLCKTLQIAPIMLFSVKVTSLHVKCMHRYVASPFLTYAGLSYDDISAGITYAFAIRTGKLTRIASLLDNSSIIVEYHGHEYPVLFTHSNGKSLNISYADSGLISYVDLLDEENTIVKTRSVTCVCA